MDNIPYKGACIACERWRRRPRRKPFFLRLLEFATHAIIIMISSNDELGTSPGFTHIHTHTHTHTHTLMYIYSNTNNNKCYIINNERASRLLAYNALDRPVGRPKERSRTMQSRHRTNITRYGSSPSPHQYKRFDIV